MLKILFILLFLSLGVQNAKIIALHSKDEKKFFDILTLGFTWNILIIALGAMVLALKGKYSLIVLLGIMFLFVVVEGIYCYGKNSVNIFSLYERNGINWCFIAILMLAGALYFLFPTTYLLAGRDPGVYLVNGVHISDSGSYDYETDVYLNDNYDKLKDLVKLGYVGIYSDYDKDLSENYGDLTTQFLPLFPSLLAVGYSLFGTAGLIRVNALLAVFSLSIIYIICKNAFDSKTGTIAILFLAISPAQIWTARNTLTEILSQLLFFLAMYYFGAGWKEKQNMKAIICGALLGFSGLNRIDTYIYGVGVFSIVLYCFFVNREKIRYTWVNALSYILSSMISLSVSWIYSRPYIIEHWNLGLKLLVTVNFCMLLLSLLTGIAYVFWIKRYSEIDICGWFEKRHSGEIAGAVCFAVFLLFYFIRPKVQPGFAGDAMRQFCWYSSVIAVIFMIFGIIVVLKNAKQYEYLFFLMGTCAVTLAGYIINPSITPDHIWASRRWISVSIPFVMIFASVGLLYWEKNKYYHYVQYASVFFISVYLLYQSSTFLFTPILKGMEEQYEKVAQRLDDDTLYISQNEEIASILRYIYHKKVYYCGNTGLSRKQMIRFLSKNQECEMIGRAGVWPGIQTELVWADTISGTFLEKVYDKFPRSLYNRTTPASLYKLSLNDNQNACYIDLSQMGLENASYYPETGIVSNGSSGCIFYGPYMSLEKGDYEIMIQLESDDKILDGQLEIVSGETTYANAAFHKQGELSLAFSLDKDVDNIEIRMSDNHGTSIVCREIYIALLEEKEE